MHTGSFVNLHHQVQDKGNTLSATCSTPINTHVPTSHAVPYTHLTLPTNLSVNNTGAGVHVKKKKWGPLAAIAAKDHAPAWEYTQYDLR